MRVIFMSILLGIVAFLFGCDHSYQPKVRNMTHIECFAKFVHIYSLKYGMPNVIYYSFRDEIGGALNDSGKLYKGRIFSDCASYGIQSYKISLQKKLQVKGNHILFGDNYVVISIETPLAKLDTCSSNRELIMWQHGLDSTFSRLCPLLPQFWGAESQEDLLRELWSDPQWWQ
jgi:hypothetical protein